MQWFISSLLSILLCLFVPTVYSQCAPGKISGSCVKQKDPQFQIRGVLVLPTFKISNEIRRKPVAKSFLSSQVEGFPQEPNNHQSDVGSDTKSTVSESSSVGKITRDRGRTRITPFIFARRLPLRIHRIRRKYEEVRPAVDRERGRSRAWKRKGNSEKTAGRGGVGAGASDTYPTIPHDYNTSEDNDDRSREREEVRGGESKENEESTEIGGGGERNRAEETQNGDGGREMGRHGSTGETPDKSRNGESMTNEERPDNMRHGESTMNGENTDMEDNSKESVAVTNEERKSKAGKSGQADDERIESSDGDGNKGESANPGGKTNQNGMETVTASNSSTEKMEEKEIVDYHFPPKTSVPLPTCFYNPSGYVCCNLHLNNLIEDSYQALTEDPNFNPCNIEKIARTIQRNSQDKFKAPFETVVALGDFAQSIHFTGNYACKLEIDGKFMIAYATPDFEAASRPKRSLDGDVMVGNTTSLTAEPIHRMVL